MKINRATTKKTPNFFLSVTLLLALPVVAGTLEMPSTTEVKPLEQSSLLLDLEIPAVKDRDPDPQAGPRLNVKEFRVQGLIEYPEVGITREKIIQQVEAIRFDMMGEGKKLNSGYTLDELGKVSDLMAEIEKETEAEHVGPLEVQKLVFLIREQRRQRGITLGMIETVADTITRYYRERGFILAKAYIPQQQVRDGVVTLTVLLGELGEVVAHNNRRYSASQIQQAFDSNLAKPVTNESIEEKLYLLNDLPGLSVQGYFEPGSQVGDTKLNVNVVKEEWYNASLRLDNHGSDKSGKYRSFAQFSFHNPLKLGDQLELGALASFSPQNSSYGSVNYSIPVFAPSIKFSLGGSTNDFVIGTGNPEAKSNTNSDDIDGSAASVYSSLRYQFKRTRVNNYAVALDVSQTKSEIVRPQTNEIIINSTIRNIKASFDFDFLNEKRRVLQQGNVALIYSQFLDGTFFSSNKSPYIITGDYSRLSFLKVPFTKIESRVVARFFGQYTGTSLSSVNQSALAGPTRARGFLVNDYFADDSAYAAVDWIFKGPSFKDYRVGSELFSSVFQPFIFADMSYGKTYPLSEASDDGTHAELADVGLGIKINYADRIRGNLSLAAPIVAKVISSEEIAQPKTGLNVYLDLQIGF